jgi:ammonia channel protein AmtB
MVYTASYILTSIAIVFVMQMTLACMVNTYFNVVPPKNVFKLLWLSFLPVSIYNVSLLYYQETELLDDDLTTL